MDYFRKFLKQDYVFNYILTFIGFRKNSKIINKKEENSKFLNFINRKIFHKNEKEIELSQPRRVTRRLYKGLYNRDLSPEKKYDIEKNEFALNAMMVSRDNFRKKIKKIVYLICSWSYTIFVIGTLLVKPIYNIIYVINNKDASGFYIAFIFFNSIPVTQYIFGFIYFQTSHFEDFYIKRNKHTGMNFFSLIICGFSIIMSLVSYFILIKDIENDGEFPDVHFFEYKNFVFTYLWFSWIYGNLTLYTNLTAFSLVFCKHCSIIDKYINKLELNKESNDITINDIIQETLDIRHNLEYSIDMFKNIFSMFTILGGIALGLFIERIKVSSFFLFPWHKLIVYIIAQTIFILIIIKVSRNKDRLSDYIKTPIFVEKFLKRYNPKEIDEKFKDENEKEMHQMIIINTLEENASTLDWIVLNDVINEKWTEFKVMGIDISDSSLIKKGVVIVGIIFALNNIFNLS